MQSGEGVDRTGDDLWLREAYVERAGILEFEAGMERKEAERLARRLVQEEADATCRPR